MLAPVGKAPAVKEAIKAERVAFRLKRELERLDLTDPDPAERRRARHEAWRRPPRRLGRCWRPGVGLRSCPQRAMADSADPTHRALLNPVARTRPETCGKTAV